jgi:Arc/MetJ-type ribon-helix-helix transcriptional regulator
MAYQFPADVASRLAELMATGNYSSEDDVLRVALDALHDRDEDFAAIRAGWEDVQAGRYYSLAEVDDAIRQKHGIPRNS